MLKVTLELGRETRRKPPFKYAALTRVESLRRRGRLERGPAPAEFVMRASSVEYLAPARFDDLLEVFVRLARFGTTSATFEHAAYRVTDDVLMCTASQTLVLIELAGRQKTPIPDAYRRAVEDFEAGAA